MNFHISLKQLSISASMRVAKATTSLARGESVLRLIFLGGV